MVCEVYLKFRDACAKEGKGVPKTFRALAQHLYAVMGFMRAAQTWDQFITNLDIAFPRRGDTLKMPFMADPTLSQ